jgi:hypothetical protein
VYGGVDQSYIVEIKRILMISDSLVMGRYFCSEERGCGDCSTGSPGFLEYELAMRRAGI